MYISRSTSIIPIAEATSVGWTRKKSCRPGFLTGTRRSFFFVAGGARPDRAVCWVGWVKRLGGIGGEKTISVKTSFLILFISPPRANIFFFVESPFFFFF